MRLVLRTVKHPKKLIVWAAFGGGKLSRLYCEKMYAKMYTEAKRINLQKH